MLITKYYQELSNNFGKPTPITQQNPDCDGYRSYLDLTSATLFNNSTMSMFYLSCCLLKFAIELSKEKKKKAIWRRKPCFARRVPAEGASSLERVKSKRLKFTLSNVEKI